MTSLNNQYSRNNYKKVLKITDELIRRNPFYDVLYVMRIKALNELGKDASEEYWFLSEFLNEKKYKDLKKK
ncbi:hypothetical protein ACE1ET_20005 [Saccharicrinis sp. FJH62]|uniref:hypothetical protein n=1 Tax=Saccharicrinis sp. FJH62 TaxID=3344657 RepID=UPI0035D50EB4